MWDNRINHKCGGRGDGGVAGQGSCDPRPVWASSRNTPDAIKKMLHHCGTKSQIEGPLSPILREWNYARLKKEILANISILATRDIVWTGNTWKWLVTGGEERGRGRIDHDMIRLLWTMKLSRIWFVWLTFSDQDFLNSSAVVRVVPQVLHGRAAPPHRSLRPLLGRAAGREEHQWHLPLLPCPRQKGLSTLGMHRRP